MSQTTFNNTQDRNNAARGAAPSAIKILPHQPMEAINVVIKVTERLLDLSERETQALVKNDAVKLDMIQDEKEILGGHYVAAAQEFRARLGEFRKIDRKLLGKLETVQNELGERMKQNTDLIELMYLRARRKTEATLFNAQEIGQDTRFYLRETDKQETGANVIVPKPAQHQQQENAA